ncbi:BofC C-terminal domain-containing protein [Sediminibacillus albus]|uniref:Forespore regulator of the sigma-K checkpoint n=1 Tax=Sediminibacillus albus TaxID=407036 RepID=A0A1G9BMD6_9BACI|nr:BofC C-terminal domain-containing protein [Sediminibacillus albus]SDK40400.1 forespore regulator of the sigma-K checkpoint [Sediminibacillus albus]
MKRYQLLLICSLAVVGIITFAGYLSGEEQAKTIEDKANPAAKNENPAQREPLELEVTLQKHYIDGKIEESTHKEKIWAMEDFWSYYHDWQVVDQKEGEIVFKKEISDISPYMKENGYFGLAENQLTIFEGLPIHEQVIQSFYQIDTDELESYQVKQLHDGIKIDSKQVYQYVLEAYRDMAPSRSVSS